MALRTTSDLVKGVLTDDYDPTAAPDLTLYMTIANSIVTDVCLDSFYTDERLELLERLLSCHYYHRRDRRSQHEGVSGISASYKSSSGEYFCSTEYGESALELDTDGNLAALQKRLEMGGGHLGLTWLGTEGYCEQHGEVETP